jgi:hypothetical protein
MGADRVQERPPSRVPNTSVTAGRAPERVRVSASQARPGETASRTTSLPAGASSGFAGAGLTAVQVRPPSVVCTGTSAAGTGLAGLFVQASAQPSRAETICSESSHTGAWAAGSKAGGAGRAHRLWPQAARSTRARPWTVTTHNVVPDAATACG